MDINVKMGDYILNCRSVAIIINENKILFQKKVNDKYWALPGGKIKIGETSEDAIKRELCEELGISKCNVDRMHHISENFFNFNGDMYHQYIFSYIIKVDGSCYIFDNEEFCSNDDNDLIYRWFNINELNSFLVKPDYLVKLFSDMNDIGIKFISDGRC